MQTEALWNWRICELQSFWLHSNHSSCVTNIKACELHCPCIQHNIKSLFPWLNLYKVSQSNICGPSHLDGSLEAGPVFPGTRPGLVITRKLSWNPQRCLPRIWLNCSPAVSELQSVFFSLRVTARRLESSGDPAADKCLDRRGSRSHWKQWDQKGSIKAIERDQSLAGRTSLWVHTPTERIRKLACHCCQRWFYSWMSPWKWKHQETGQGEPCWSWSTAVRFKEGIW